MGNKKRKYLLLVVTLLILLPITLIACNKGPGSGSSNDVPNDIEQKEFSVTFM